MDRLAISIASLALLACGSAAPAPAPTPQPGPPANGNDTTEPVASGPTSCPADEGGETFKAMANERIGGLGLGASAKEVVELFGDADKTEGPLPNEVEGGKTWVWTFEARGVVLHLNGESDKTIDDAAVAVIMVNEKSKLETRFGIGVGASVADVEKAYGACINREESQDGGLLVVGSVYGGVLFTLKDGVVTDIFVGAGAE